MKRIAVITMVRNDDFFLRKWVDYYGDQFGKENLYVYFDGLDQQIPSFCEGCNAFLVDKIGNQVVAAEKGRLRFLSDKAAALLSNGYDLVIGVDADEYIVVDPKLGISLAQYLSEQNVTTSLSALGLDFGQKLGEETDLTHDTPFLSQRKYAQIGTRYTKPAIISRPVVWGSGFHRVKDHNYHIAPDLYLLHFGYSDKKIIEDRFGDNDRISQGWGKHIEKRSRTIRYVTEKKSLNFDRMTSTARFLQTLCRPPYAVNKPAMLGLKLIVELPPRFKEIL